MAKLEVSIVDVFRGSSRLDSEKSKPRGLFTSPDGSSVLDWIAAALEEFDVSRSVYLGSYHIQKVIKSFPEFEYRYCTISNLEGELTALNKINVSKLDDFLIIRADSLIVPEAISLMRSAEGDVIAGYYNGSHGPEFAGVLLVKAHYVEAFYDHLLSVSAQVPKASINDLIKRISVNKLDLNDKISPIYDKQAVAKTIFKGKAGTLKQLSRVKSSFVILKQISFSVEQWLSERTKILENIKRKYPSMTLVVRSSTVSEDSAISSAAGYFESVLDVFSSNDEALDTAIQTVVTSYKKEGRKPEKNDLVLVQQQIKDVASSGVLFTRDPNSKAPYFVICIDRESGRSDVITSGGKGHFDTYYISHESKMSSMPTDIVELVRGAKEQIQITNSDALDIEFAIDKKGNIYLFQLRQIVDASNSLEFKFSDSDSDFYELIDCAKEFVNSNNQERKHLAGRTNVLANMSDWNPAEMIGASPNPLAISLYQRLIGNHNWARSRSLLGYRNVEPSPLILSVAGTPYVDVRASLNSFLPLTIPKGMAEKWVDSCLERLRCDPALNDKIEFDLLPTCLSFDWGKHEKQLSMAGFLEKDIKIFRLEYLKLTENWIKTETISEALEQLSLLSDRRNEFLENTDVSANTLARRAYDLLNDCERLGVVPFASLARMGFVALTFLRSLSDVGIISNEDLGFILQSIPTIARDINRDMLSLSIGELNRDVFIKKYGHLRENSYEITSLNYGDSLDRYITSVNQLPDELPSLEEGRACFLLKREQINYLLKKFGFTISSEQLFDFIHKAISARELAKFEFMKNINEALETTVKFGACFQLSRDDMSYIPIDEILTYANSSLSGATGIRLRRSVGFHKKRMLLTRSIKLPDVIRSSTDVDAHQLSTWRPNFVTHHKVTAPVVVIDSNVNGYDLTGKIVAIRAADPGYDWIFSHSIVGLITQYGGIGSHMAIRAAEFSLPAAIGCGSSIFEDIRTTNIITLDCLNQKLVIQS